MSNSRTQHNIGVATMDSRYVNIIGDTMTGVLTSPNFVSNIAIGTQPYATTSTTLNTNLNADLLDSQQGSYYLDSANFSGTNWTDLTDTGATTLHKHDHGGLDGLTDDDHTQYAKSIGVGRNSLTSPADTTLTIPATGTVALLGTANTFSINQVIDGSSDAIQLRVQGHSTQTSDLFVLENSAGTDFMAVSGVGNVGIGVVPNTAYKLQVNTTSTTAAESGTGVYGYMNATMGAGETGTAGYAKNGLYGRVDVAVTDAATTSAPHFTGAYNVAVIKATHAGTASYVEANRVIMQMTADGAGTITNLTGYVLGTYGSGANTTAITNLRMLHINTTNFTGQNTPVNTYGLYVENITGSSLAYAIYTNTGIIHAGDKIEFTQTDGNEYIDSLNDGYIDIGATTAVRLLQNTTISGTLTVGSVTNSGGQVSVVGTTADNSAFWGTCYVDSTVSPQFALRKARGTEAIPTTVLSADGLGAISFRGYNGEAWTGSKGYIVCAATQDWTTTANGTQIRIGTTSNDSTTLTARVTIDQGGNVYINDTANTTTSLGLTINQGGYDDEILSLKSSDVAHGITDFTETDTYFSIRKLSAAAGGGGLYGFSEATVAVSFTGMGVTDNTTKTTAARAYVENVAYKKSGTSYGAAGADANLMVISNAGTARFIFDAEGELFIPGSSTTDQIGNGLWFINESANTNMTAGLTINQGANDDEILSLKSSDVAHGMTDIAETDTYGVFKKVSLTAGGLGIEGYGELEYGLRMRGVGSTANTAKTTAALGAFLLDGALKSTTTYGAMSADGNLVVIRNNTTAEFIFDAEGSAHANVEWTTFDEYTDVELLNALEEEFEMRKGNKPVKTGEEKVKHEAKLKIIKDSKIISFDDDTTTHGFVNFTKLAMLKTGAIRQLEARINKLENKLN